MSTRLGRAPDPAMTDVDDTSSERAREGKVYRDRTTYTVVYKTTQPCLLLLLGRLSSAALVAYWNTSRTPSPVRAEHSR